MASGINIGSFRDKIKVYFVKSQTTGDMGGRVLTYDIYSVNADVVQTKANQNLQMGLDAMSENYSVTCRPPAAGRPHLIDYRGEQFTVIHAERDKLNQFLYMIMTIKR
jgi:hypothetical protein